MKKLPVIDFSPTERFIILELSTGIKTAINLVDLYISKFPQSSKQSIYVALRKLLKKEVVAGSSKKGLSLTRSWIDSLNEFTSSISTDNDPIVNLKDKESFTYTFNNLTVCDIFWDHAVRVMLPTTNKATPLVFINPHQWFFVAREKSEESFWNHLNSEGFISLMCVSGNTPLDYYIGSTLFSTTQNLKFSPVDDKKLKVSTYINVIGEYIITVILNKKISSEIDAWYKNTNKITEHTKQTINTIINQKGMAKMNILRDSKKADMYRKKYQKYFAL